MNRFLFLLLTFQLVHGAPPTGEALKGIAEDYFAKEAIPVQEKGFGMEEGVKTQGALVELLSKKLGPVAGYKIGLITKVNQERMGATGPVRGTLLKEMLLKNRSVVATNFGTRTSMELDMGVLVKDEGINDAKSVAEVAAHLSDLVCFIELVDTITPTNQVMDAALLTALNVGARAGVLGDKRRMSQDLAEALPEMKMVLEDSKGKTIAQVEKLALQPLENIPGLVESLKKEGKKLKAGDFISLGSPASPQPIPAGGTVNLRYYNLPGGQMSASVTFGSAAGR